MMKLLLLASLFVFTGCATKYLIPGNRFITPESQGQAFRAQIELQQTGANQLTIDTAGGSVDDGVKYEQVTRTGFLFSNSIFDQFDLIWSHTGGANSMLGGKFQFIGSSRVAGGAGHKAAIGVLFGGNEHETDDESIEFELSGREYLLLYGYRISPNIFPYLSLSIANYNFSGKIVKGPFRGQEPEYVTDSKGLNTGVEFSINNFFAKLEATYQQLATEKTKDKESFTFGYSLGFSW